jgi:chloramphenicol-sensitive protein RarD
MRERLRSAQWAAFGIAACAVAILTMAYGRPPWIALTLATSFGLYGLVKKLAGVDAVSSLTIETALVAPAMLAYVTWLASRGVAAFGHVSPLHTGLMAFSGVATALPLLCFSAAAIRIPLSTLGLLQYVAPVLQFGVGVVVRHEPMPAPRWVGFGVVWFALAIFSYDAVSTARRRGREVEQTTVR